MTLFDWAALGFVLLCCAASVAKGLWVDDERLGVANMPAILFFALAAEAALFATLDARFIWLGGVSGSKRIARHLWRMIAGLIFAAFAFFVANPQVFPQAMRKPYVLYAPIWVLLVVLVYWLVRVRRPSRGAGAASTTRSR